MNRFPPWLLKELKTRDVPKQSVASVEIKTQTVKCGTTADAQRLAGSGLQVQPWEMDDLVVGHDVVVVQHDGTKIEFHIPATA